MKNSKMKSENGFMNHGECVPKLFFCVYTFFAHRKSNVRLAPGQNEQTRTNK